MNKKYLNYEYYYFLKHHYTTKVTMVISSRPRTPGSCSSLDYHEQMYTNLSMVQQHRNRKANFKKLRYSSSSPTSTSSADSLPIANTRKHPYKRIVPQEHFPPYIPSETLRSSRSMPGLSIGSTSDGLPCPVHHMQKVLNLHQLPNFVPRRSGSMYELRASPAPSFYAQRASPAPSFYAPMPQHRMYAPQSHYGSLRSIHSGKSAAPFLIPNPVMAPQQPLIMPSLPPIPMHLPPMPPTYLLPPGARPQPLVIPAEPLPVRNMNKREAPLAIQYKKKKKYSCCHGPMPVVWFVVILVSFGVILGIILWATLG
uniref:Uncharacterized protein n=1 Tax=Strigamia maritima TaxID=126957 RepID=T1IQX8_STRMM